MCETTYKTGRHKRTFTRSQIINPNEYIPHGAYNPQKIKAWYLYGPYGTIGVVFAESLEDALDEAVDAEKMEGYRLGEDTSEDDEEMTQEESDQYASLGNFGDLFDIHCVQAFTFKMPFDCRDPDIIADDED